MSAMDAQLLAAYENTDYCLWLGGGELKLRIGQPLPALIQRIVAGSPNTEACIITPCNPHSRRLTDADNRARLGEFRDQLDADGIRWLPAVNRDPDGEWPEEPGALLLNATPEYAFALARRFNQNALVALAPSATPRLVWIEPDQPPAP